MLAAALSANLARVHRQIRAACERSGRDPASVRLIAVAKTVPAEMVRTAIEAGIREIGENYVREAQTKRSALADVHVAVTWHLIGHLQSNKAGAALETFDMIQAVDSVRLAEALSRRARRPTPILLEVNAAREPSKFGFDPDDIASAVIRIAHLENLDLRGLMTVAPAADEPELVRPVFRDLRQLASASGLAELSMGMTGDFEVAIEEGSTMVRIGRAIFGERRL